MKCFVLKLKEGATGDLPVIPEVVKKTWLSKTDNDQFIDLSSYISGLKANDVLLEINLKRLSVGNRGFILGTRGSLGILDLPSNHQLRIYNAEYVPALDVINSEHLLIVNSSAKTIQIDDGEPSVMTANPSGLSFNKMYIFKQDEDTNIINTGVVKIGSIKITKISTNTVLLNAFPALVGNVPCLYDTLTGNVIIANSGDLMVE